MDLNAIAILSTMVIGFISVVFSLHAMIRSDMNRRFDEQKGYMDQRFVEQKEYMDHRFAEQKEEINEIKLGLNAMRNRLDTFIDNFALRVITEGRKSSRKTV